MRKNKLNTTNITVAITSIVVVFLFQHMVSLHSADKDDRGTLIFMGNNQIAPILYEENGEAKGIAADIAKALGERIGYSVEIKAVNWDEAQDKVLLGQADALLHINPSRERDAIYDFSQALRCSEFSIFKQHDNRSIYSARDLKGKVVGVESGGYPFHMLKNMEQVQLVIIDDWEKGFGKLGSQEIDAIVADRWIGEYHLARSRVEGIEILEKPIESLYSHIAVKKGNQQILDLINSGLEALYDDGTMADILNEWQGKKVVYFTEESLRRRIWLISSGVLVSVVLLSVISLRKFKQLSRMNEELEQMTMLDPLTGLYNRRYFDVVLEKVWYENKQKMHQVSVIMIDIDKFKHYNDTYGHLAGDGCLKQVAKVIKHALNGPEDVIARFGGEEFVILLSNSSADQAMVIAEKIRDKIEKLCIKHKDAVTKVTISLGIASSVPDKKQTPERLIKIADQALYQAKSEGRNRVVLASEVR